MDKIRFFRNLIQNFFGQFTAPSLLLFQKIFEGWLLCPGTRYVTSMAYFGDPKGEHAHDAFHRFFREAKWSLKRVFFTLTRLLVSSLGLKRLKVGGDDSVHKKTGRKVEGAKRCRDAVRSTKNKVVICWGLQVVLLFLIIQTPWEGGEPLALPIGIRLYRKRVNDQGPTLLDLMWDMLLVLCRMFPDLKIDFVTDGYYASLAGRERPDNLTITSRMRLDAALFEFPVASTGKKVGRPRVKGERIPSPKEMVQVESGWREVATLERRKKRTRLVITRKVMWKLAKKWTRLLLVISRDPLGKEHDDFFFTTDLEADPASVISDYANRWTVEETFRNTKQNLGVEEPQSWKDKGPERVAGMGYVCYSLTWLWFIKCGDYRPQIISPWYPKKILPSFADAIALFRREIFRRRFMQGMDRDPQATKFMEACIECLARVA